MAEADPDALTPQLRERLVAGLEAERDEHVDPEDLAPRVEEAQGELEQSRLEIAGWELDGDWKTVSAGLERSYGRGREALGQVRETPDDDATVHEWRKRVKDLWYQLRLLRDSWEGVIAATVDELDRLSDLLGEHHDLAVLAEDVEARMPQPDGDAAQLVKAAGRRQRELLAEALPVGERIYTESPRRFSKRVGSYWEAWRSEESEPDGWA
ncbi:MAG: CHAD domain-containing protein [Solirubrobacterales bacterium]|nr:CHAD domain-containing protein [Solirubrobacterales bacterium]